MKKHFSNVLFVGPHHSLRGGMASVLKVYSETLENFHFLSTYYYKNPVLNLLYFTKSVLQFIWICTVEKIKIVHIHAACRGSFIRKSIILQLARLLGKKTILHIHGGEFKVYYQNSGILKRYILYTLNAADQLAVLSEEWKIYFDSLTKKQNAIILNNPVKMDAQVMPNITQLPVQLLYMNHVTEKKGIFDIVSVFIKNKAIYKGSLKLNIAGAGAELEKLQLLIKENALQDVVEYKGWVSGPAKDELIKACNLFILTSYYEGLPMSILESMALGKAIVSSDVGGIPGIVKPGQNGWLLKAGDTKALEAIFSEIQNNPKIPERYGLASFAMVQPFSPQRVSEALNNMYEELLQPASAPHSAVYKKAE